MSPHRIIIEHRAARAALGLLAASLLATAAGAEELKASAVMQGCENPAIKGEATLVEHTSPEGIKEVTVEMKISGLTDGKHVYRMLAVGTHPRIRQMRALRRRWRTPRSRSLRSVPTGQRR